MSEAMAAVERAVRFGIKINKNEEDSNKRVTYLYDAAGMIPAVMDFVEGTFNYGSWGNVEFVKNNYTDKVADGSLEKEIEEKVLFDVDYTKYQDTIESEDMVQTAYEFTIYEKVRKKG